MSTELTVQENKSVSVFDSDQFNHWMNVAQKLASSDMVPKHYKAKPMDILIAIDMGKAVGLPMMQALQSIAVINGMPSMYGDSPLAVCQSHPSFEWIKEEALMKGNDIDGYQCTVKRRNNDPHTVVFTVADAKKANLWGKPGPWTQYASRMLQMRARGFALRNTFPDALKGIHIAEEIQDIQTIDGEWTPKQTQKDKMKSLLTKKGLNNATTNNINENNSTTVDANYTIDADGVYNKNNDITSQNIKGDAHQILVENGESKAGDANTKDDFVSCTQEQLVSIDFLISEKKVDKAGQLKCLDYFNVTSFGELTYKQAEAVVKKLNAMEQPEE
jgi:hypothetical protein